MHYGAQQPHVAAWLMGAQASLHTQPPPAPLPLGLPRAHAPSVHLLCAFSCRSWLPLHSGVRMAGEEGEGSAAQALLLHLCQLWVAAVEWLAGPVGGSAPGTAERCVRGSNCGRARVRV